MNLEQSVRQVKDKIEEACLRAGRKSEEVQLIAVSKTIPVQIVKQAFDAGLRVFGENKAQELRDKVPVLPREIQWHFIGHLQKNKIKYVIPAAVLIHSVDSLNLAVALSEHGSKNGCSPDILIEVNTSGESSKYGLEPEKTEDIFFRIRELKQVNIKGFMTMAPFTEDEAMVRKSFRTLFKLREKIQDQLGQENQFELSMGMSGDFEIAIEEGSTMVRVGTSIFGARGRSF